MKAKCYFMLFIAMFLLLVHSISYATVHNVPSTYSTIQAGLNACATGDTVLVAIGTYTLVDTYIVWPNTANIKLLSVGDSSNTIIDANGNYHIFYIDPDTSIITIDTNTVIDGFKITGGNANSSAPHNYGGGIYCDNSSPTISNNNITGNSAIYGGGIYCFSSTINNNTITSNSADYGGGIFCFSSTINNNTITSNSANYGGGGIFCAAFPTISNNTITGNSADDGGGIFCEYSSSPTISNNTITSNSANDDGGGIYCTSSSPTICNNSIIGNSANNGGGIYRYNIDSNPILGGHPDSSNNIYHNYPDNYYNNDNSFVEATHNYWGNFDDSTIEGTFSGNTTYIDYLPTVSEPVQMSYYVTANSDIVYFPELTITVDSLAGEGLIIEKTYINTPPPSTDSLAANKYWLLDIYVSVTYFSGQLTLHYTDDEINESETLVCAYWDLYASESEWTNYTSVMDTTENTITCSIIGNDLLSGIWAIRISNPVGIEEELEDNIISDYVLMQNYPNPFNPSTVIKYQLPNTSHTQLNIYNIKGQLVKTLINETQNAGYYNITWDGKNNDNREVASGLYVYRITAGDYVETRKMLLLK